MAALYLKPRNLGLSARLFSTSAKTTPSKAHHFINLPDASFPHSYLVTGVHVGVKKKPDVPDLGLVVSTTPRTSSAACFTRNAFKAAPVLVSDHVLKDTNGRASALVLNSGCANAVTGKQGMDDAWAMSRTTNGLIPSTAEVKGSLVMSTGVIGQNLPIKKILDGITSSTTKASLGSDFASWVSCARAFMTTDTFPKLRARSFTLPGGRTVRIAGIDKGAGMIHPNMGPPHATLLGLIATDAAVSPRSLQNALTWAVDRSFNSITVDGDMSTNDTIIAFANGAAGGEEIEETKDAEAYKVFRDELTSFAVELAQLVVRDGEGATKFVTVSVEGAPSYEDAHKVASSVATSSLVKTALYGEDANWGRILAAVGYTPALSTPIEPTRVSVSFVPSDGSEILRLLVNGEPEKVDEDRAKVILQREDLEIKIELGLGNEGAKYYTCDFSHEYVTINGDYRS